MRGAHLASFLLAVASLLLAGCAVRGTAERDSGSALASVAGGSYSHDTRGAPPKGDTTAGLGRLLVESNTDTGWGGGIAGEYLLSDDDLFAEEVFTSTDATAIDIALYLLYRVSDGERFRMPVRVGPYGHSLELDAEAGRESTRWSTWGFRVAAAPEVVLARDREFACSLCSEVSIGFGESDVDQKTPVGDRSYSASAVMFGFELGPRLRFSRFVMGLSWIHRGISMDDSERKNGIFVRGFEGSFDGLALTFGARL